MKLIKKHNTKIYIILGFVLLAAGILCYAFILNGSIFGWQFYPNSPTSINLQPPTSTEKETGQQIKKDSVEYNQGKPTNNDSPSSTSPSNAIVVGFSAINQNDTTLQVRTIIQEVLSTGSCDITFQKSDQIVTKTAPVYPNASISTCQGFDIPIEELSPGTWEVTVKITSSNRSGSIATTTQIN